MKHPEGIEKINDGTSSVDEKYTRLDSTIPVCDEYECVDGNSSIDEVYEPIEVKKADEEVKLINE